MCTRIQSVQIQYRIQHSAMQIHVGVRGVSVMHAAESLRSPLSNHHSSPNSLICLVRRGVVLHGGGGVGGGVVSMVQPLYLSYLNRYGIRLQLRILI